MNYLLLALNIGNELMKKIPDYDQKKRQQFFNKTTQLQDEWNKPYDKRDDDLILNLRDELSAFLEAFYKEIKS